MAAFAALVVIVEGQTLEIDMAAGRKPGALSRLGTCPQLFGTRIKASVA